MVTNTMSGCWAMIWSGRSPSPNTERLLTKPSPFTLGLNSVHPRCSQITVDQRAAGSLAPVPRVYESP
jgi:hypothetical protein